MEFVLILQWPSLTASASDVRHFADAQCRAANLVRSGAIVVVVVSVIVRRIAGFGFDVRPRKNRGRQSERRTGEVKGEVAGRTTAGVGKYSIPKYGDRSKKERSGLL